MRARSAALVSGSSSSSAPTQPADLKAVDPPAKPGDQANTVHVSLTGGAVKVTLQATKPGGATPVKGLVIDQNYPLPDHVSVQGTLRPTNSDGKMSFKLVPDTGGGTHAGYTATLTLKSLPPYDASITIHIIIDP
jgi:hypothetical protein